MVAGRFLADEERVLGAEHPNTLRTRHELAVAYEDAGRAGEAIAILEPLVTQPERILGRAHPDTLTARDTLAGAYRASGREAEAAAVEEGRGEGDAR